MTPAPTAKQLAADLSPGRAADAGAVLFFVVPVALVVVVSFFRYQMLVGIVPDFTFKNYVDLLSNPTTWTLYLSTLKFTLIVLAITFVLGFWIAYFLVFHVRNLLTAIGLFLVCTVPFWTSNIIRMISWRPVLGKEGLINSALLEDGRHRPAAATGCSIPISRWWSPMSTSSRCS